MDSKTDPATEHDDMDSHNVESTIPTSELCKDSQGGHAEKSTKKESQANVPPSSQSNDSRENVKKVDIEKLADQNKDFLKSLWKKSSPSALKSTAEPKRKKDVENRPKRDNIRSSSSVNKERQRMRWTQAERQRWQQSFGPPTLQSFANAPRKCFPPDYDSDDDIDSEDENLIMNDLNNPPYDAYDEEERPTNEFFLLSFENGSFPMGQSPLHYQSRRSQKVSVLLPVYRYPYNGKIKGGGWGRERALTEMEMDNNADANDRENYKIETKTSQESEVESEPSQRSNHSDNLMTAEVSSENKTVEDDINLMEKQNIPWNQTATRIKPGTQGVKTVDTGSPGSGNVSVAFTLSQNTDNATIFSLSLNSGTSTKAPPKPPRRKQSPTAKLRERANPIYDSSSDDELEIRASDLSPPTRRSHNEIYENESYPSDFGESSIESRDLENFGSYSLHSSADMGNAMSWSNATNDNNLQRFTRKQQTHASYSNIPKPNESRPATKDSDNSSIYYNNPAYVSSVRSSNDDFTHSSPWEHQHEHHHHHSDHYQGDEESWDDHHHCHHQHHCCHGHNMDQSSYRPGYSSHSGYSSYHRQNKVTQEESSSDDTDYHDTNSSSHLSSCDDDKHTLISNKRKEEHPPPLSRPPVRIPSSDQPSSISDSEDLPPEPPPRCGCGHCKNCRAGKTLKMMQTLAESIGREIHDVIPDGNCMFRSIIDQLRMQGEINWTSMQLRLKAVKYLRDNPFHEDGTHLSDFLSADSCTWEEYLKKMEKDAEWGDNIILRGLAEVISRKICIISAFGDLHNQTTVAPTKTPVSQSENVVLGHIEDQHYVSLRDSNWRETWFKRARGIVGKEHGHQLQDYDPCALGNVLTKEELPPMDILSGTPFFHLSFIIKKVLPQRFFRKVSKAMVSDMRRRMGQTNTAGMYGTLFGSAPEGLAATLINRSVTSPDATDDNAFMPHFLFIDQKIEPVITISEATNRGSVKQLKISCDDVHVGHLRLSCTKPFLEPEYYEVRCVHKTDFLKHKEMSKSRRRHYEDYNDRDRDAKFGFVCKERPTVYLSSWMKRDRPSGWPEQGLIQEVLEEDLMILPLAHPSSKEPDIEWAFGFSRAEELLATSLTKIQKYCFHVFQVLIKYHVEDGHLLKRYFLKNVFFYALERIPLKQWECDLGACFLHLLDQIIHAIRSRNLPHYFIPENNLIDYMEVDICRHLVTKLEAVREFPIMSTILLAEAHGLSSSWVADAVLEDIPRFMQHKDLSRSIMEVIIPTYIRDIHNELMFMFYKSATKLFMEAFEDISAGQNPVALSFEDLLQQMLLDVPYIHRWWFCFFLDLLHKKNSLDLIFRDEKGILLYELIGKSDEAGPLWAIKIPHALMRETSSCRMYTAPIGFLFEMCLLLYTQHVNEPAVIYFRILIQIIKDKLQKNIVHDSETNATQTECNIPHIGSNMPHVSVASRERKYAIHVQNSSLSQLLYRTMVTLFNIYNTLGQSHLFSEYVQELETVCDTLATKEAYKNLAQIWWYLGADEKYYETMEKRDFVPESESVTYL